jgi:hypothetical protein
MIFAALGPTAITTSMTIGGGKGTRGLRSVAGGVTEGGEHNCCPLEAAKAVAESKTT